MMIEVPLPGARALLHENRRIRRTGRGILGKENVVSVFRAPLPRDGSPPAKGFTGRVGPPAAATSDDSVATGMRIAAAWSWRVLVVAGALAVIYLVLSYLSEISIPITIALLLCALFHPAKRVLVDHRWKPTLATVVVFLGGLIAVGAVITLVVQQFVAAPPTSPDERLTESAPFKVG